MKWKAVVPIAIILAVLALTLIACGPDVKERPTTTESGLQYEVIEPGEGPAPEPGDVVSIHYSATLEDGTEIDDTYERGEPAAFVLGKGIVIPGWDEGVALMHEGEKAKLVIPPELAFGDQGLSLIHI